MSRGIDIRTRWREPPRVADGSISGMTTHPSIPDRPRAPVCGMAVRTDVAVEDGLVAEYDSHTYYFCREGCLEQFRTSPAQYITSHHHAEAATTPTSTIEIDAGMRLWYES